jgi:hypothetical protein
MAWIGGAALAVVISGCSLVGAPVPVGAGVPPGPLAPVVPNPNGGPPVECRAIPQRACLGLVEPGTWPVDATVVRIIVTCVARCTETEGDVSIDVVDADNRVRNLGGSAYAGLSAP